MSLVSESAWRYLMAVSLGAGMAALAGCGDSSVKLVPVVGKVTVDGQPLRTGEGSVSFRPEKGSENRKEPAGAIDPDGNYRLLTDGKDGAPPGRYRVLVVAVDPIDPNSGFPYPQKKRKSYISYKYMDPKTTDLIIDVVESAAPGAYDLKLKK